MPPLAEQLKQVYEDADRRAREAWGAFAKAREDATKEGVDFATDTEAFDHLDGLKKVHSGAAQEAATLKDRYLRLLEMDGDSGAPTAHPLAPSSVGEPKRMLSAASRVLESEGYKALVSSGALNLSQARVSLSPIKALDRAELKALLTGASDTSAGALFTEDRLPGYVELPRRERRMMNLVTVGDTDTDAVEFVRMATRTNSAAERPEATSTTDAAANAPESAFAFEIVQESVREIPHYIPATRRAMADAGQLRTIIDQELREGVLERLDSQILNGDGVGDNLRGILNTTGIGSRARDTVGGESRSDAIHRAMTIIVLNFYEPDAIVMDPRDWEEVRLEKDANGNYIYGPPSQPGAPTMWGLPVTATQAIAQGNPLVGAYRRGATLWLREGVQISATDSHADWFIRRLVAVMAAMRGAFGVQRPGAFCEVTAF